MLGLEEGERKRQRGRENERQWKNNNVESDAGVFRKRKNEPGDREVMDEGESGWHGCDRRELPSPFFRLVM